LGRRKITALGIALIVIGVALVCAGLIFQPPAPRTEDEDKADAGSTAELLRDEGDKDSSK
jgi:uncharacterized membrane protein